MEASGSVACTYLILQILIETRRTLNEDVFAKRAEYSGVEWEVT